MFHLSPLLDNLHHFIHEMYTQLINGKWNEMILFREKFQLRLSVEEEGEWTWRECYEVNCLTDSLPATWMTRLSVWQLPLEVEN